ncbi:yippee-like [Thalictrum thalictroides]|uniref:Protein yippee-like n=1 Tax=Thalictrum thalictroides TaxID=46969 RepID=A0A7J6X0A0_THATH|nr:yippee-like [Thalictrum thalictroides]
MIYKCKCCRVDLTCYDQILSKKFCSNNGKAFLFDKVVNITLGPNEDKELVTGFHTICDIYCSSCQQKLGWKYEKAYSEDQKYKEGKYILEKVRILKSW